MAARGAERLVLQRDGHRGQAVLAFTRADVDYLCSGTGAAALAEVAEFTLADSNRAPRVADIAALRARFGARTPILVETTLLRRRAAAKLADLPGTARWLFTDDALQQASAAPVARHRARRIAAAVPGVAVHDVTCSIGTELAVLSEAAAPALGSDIDPVRLAMARHNLNALDGPDGVILARADALAPVSRDTVVLADPGRRSGGRRRFNPADYRPGLDRLLDVYADRDIVVKCAPGIDFGWLQRLGFHGEIEITSWRGSVREACLWSRGLSEPGVRRRATILDRDEQITDAEPDKPGGPGGDVRPAGRWIIDPDGAVVRAGLVRHYGARHGLWQLDPEIAYLSGDRLPAGMRGFEVLEQLAYSEKRLREALAALDCGALEILVRGVPEVQVDPDGLRRRLRLGRRGRSGGARSLAVVITRIGARTSGRARRVMAYICSPSR